MLKIIATIVITVVVLPAYLYAQEHTVLKPDGEIIKKYSDLKTVEVQRVKKGRSGNMEQQNVIKTFSRVPFFGQDVMVQWFVAPADLFIH